MVHGFEAKSYYNCAGPLSAVTSLAISSQDSAQLTWVAPFTFDISTTEIDITYCVTVNSTSLSTPFMECGINMTEFSYPIPDGTECEDRVFTITPENAAGFGNTSTISYSQALIRMF